MQLFIMKIILNKIIENKNNIFVDDFFEKINEENLFHIINHCYNNNLKILLCTDNISIKL